MDNKKMIAVLAVTVLAIPVAMSGCGKPDDTASIDTDTTVTETVTDNTVSETIEEDLSNMGIVVESDLDESMAGTYYVIAEEGIPYYAEDDTTSEVLGTLAYDTEVISLGMSQKTSLFQIELEDGSRVWVENGNLDTFKGGYDEDIHLVKDGDKTKEESEYTPQTNNSLPADSNSGFLTDEELNNILIQYGFSPESSYNPANDEEYVFGQGDYSDIVPHTVQ